MAVSMFCAFLRYIPFTIAPCCNCMPLITRAALCPSPTFAGLFVLPFPRASVLIPRVFAISGDHK